VILDFSDWSSLVFDGSFQTSGWIRSVSISESLFSRKGISKIPPHGAQACADFSYLLLVICYHGTLALTPEYNIVNAAIVAAEAHKSARSGPKRT